MPRPSIDQTLTGREVEMLSWIMAGKTDWEIAAILRLSRKTVNYHVENAKKKLGSTHRITAVALALRDGLIPFPVRQALTDTATSPSFARRAGCDSDVDLALLWVFDPWQIPDDSGAGPCPAALFAH